MPCSCISDMDAKLGPYNTRLAVTFGFPRNGGPSFTRPTIQTEKIESRKRGSAALALASYCPFCGVSYEDPTA